MADLKGEKNEIMRFIKPENCFLNKLLGERIEVMLL